MPVPPTSATYYHFAAWRDDGIHKIVHELLRCQVREKARRLENPALVVLDAQSVHVAAGVPAPRPAGAWRNACPAASGAWSWTCIHSRCHPSDHRLRTSEFHSHPHH